MSDDDDHGLDASDAADRRILLTVLLINLGQCLAGVGVGVWASSTALIGAALDNLSDALVYGVSLYAIGRSVTIKVRAARLSGWLLIGLAVVGFLWNFWLMALHITRAIPPQGPVQFRGILRASRNLLESL